MQKSLNCFLLSFAILLSLICVSIFSVDSYAFVGGSGILPTYPLPRIGDAVTDPHNITGQGIDSTLTVSNVDRIVSTSSESLNFVLFIYQFEETGNDWYHVVTYNGSGWYLENAVPSTLKTKDDIIFMFNQLADVQITALSIYTDNNAIIFHNTDYTYDWSRIDTSSEKVSITKKNPIIPPNTYSEPAHVHDWVYTVFSEPTEEYDGSDGYKCSLCGEIKDVQSIPAVFSMFDNRYATITNSEQGQNIVLDMKNFDSLPKELFEKIALKKDVSFTIKFISNHKQYEIYIPSGTVVDTNHEYYGVQKLISLYKYKIID